MSAVVRDTEICVSEDHTRRMTDSCDNAGVYDTVAATAKKNCPSACYHAVYCRAGGADRWRSLHKKD